MGVLLDTGAVCRLPKAAPALVWLWGQPFCWGLVPRTRSSSPSLAIGWSWGLGTRSQGSRALQNATRAAADIKLYLCSVAPLLFRQQWQHVPRQPQLGTVQS